MRRSPTDGRGNAGRHRLRPARALLLAAAVAAVPQAAGCGDPTAPGSLHGTYRLAYVSEGRGIRRPPASFGVYQSSAVLRVAGGVLSLRPDSTFDLRWVASRDSAGRSAALPLVLASGRYRAIPTNGDNAFDYHLEFTTDERPDDTFTASRDNFEGHVVVCCMIVETVPLSFIFDPWLRAAPPVGTARPPSGSDRGAREGGPA